MYNWILALRPKTLTAAVVPVMVATALVRAEGYEVLWVMSFFSILATIFIQIGTNFINDAIDFKKGADTEERLGPQRVTQSGLLSGKQVMLGGFLSFLFAILCGVPLVLQGGLPILIIGFLSVLLGYAYTAGPVPLAYKGLGDLFVILFFGLVAVGGVFYLHTGNYSLSAVIAGLQVGFLATVLIVINNIRDIEQDRKVNKKTLAVRFGQKFSKYEILILFLLAFLLNIFWIQKGFINAGLLPLLALPLVRRLIREVIKHAPGIVYNQFLAKAALIQILFGIALTLGLWTA